MRLNPFNVLIIACLIFIGLPFIASIFLIALPFLLLFVLFGSPVTRRQTAFKWYPRNGRKAEREVNDAPDGKNGSDGDVCDVECKVLKTETIDEDGTKR